MEQTLKRLDLNFFGKGMHAVQAEAFFNHDKALLVDVRTKEEAATLPLTLALYDNIAMVNIPLNELPDRLNEIPDDVPVAVFCPMHVRSSMALGFLMSRGHDNVRILMGGYAAVTDQVLPGKVLQLSLAAG